MVECDICGDEFDTERGMKIHRTGVHSEDDNSVEKEGDNVSEEEDEGRVQVDLKTGHLMLVFLCVGFVIGGFGGYMASDVVNILENSGGIAQPEDSGSQPSLSPSEISLEGEPVLGEEDAPVTLLIYEDFECPYCEQLEMNAMPEIVDNYVETGKVKLVWKDRPLSRLHPWAADAAATMECVYREGGNDAFWPVKNQIFENQKSISTSNVQSKIKQWAANEGVSESAVQTCLDNGNPMEEVNNDSSNGRAAGVSGTPTVFVGDEELVGAQPYSRFKNVIDQQLGGQ
jgi:protein-disulfide isomerase